MIPRRKIGRRAVMTLALTTALIMGACATDTDPQTPAQAVSAERAAATATPVPPTPEVEAELPPGDSEEGEPIEPDVAQTAAFGLFEICSLYEGERLSELVGEFWLFDDGVERQDKCLWSTPIGESPKAIVSITLSPTTESDNAGTTVVSETGAGVQMTIQGNELQVNVVSDDVDPTFGELNAEEAERRIADDVYERLTGNERPAVDG